MKEIQNKLWSHGNLVSFLQCMMTYLMLCELRYFLNLLNLLFVLYKYIVVLSKRSKPILITLNYNSASMNDHRSNEISSWWCNIF